MSDKPKWTPGPWYKCGTRRDSYNAITSIKVGSAPAYMIAETFGAPKGDLSQVNARLIAAAPEMAEALAKLLIRYRIDAGEECYQDDPASVAARAALRKARGED